MQNQAALKRVGLVLATGFGLSALLTCGAALASDTGVQINGDAGGNSYTPGNLTVNPGDSVTWTNRDPAGTSHNAVCSTLDGCPVNMAPNGGKLYGTNQSASFTFQYSGTYAYHCNAHPNMKGTVVVTGDVHPPSSSGSGSGSGSTPAAGGSTAGGGGTAGGTVASGGAAAPSSKATRKPGSATAATLDPNATDTTSTSTAVRQALEGVTLPRPNVIVKNAGDSRTPTWVVLASGAALVVCAILFGLAWFGPRFGRRGGNR